MAERFWEIVDAVEFPLLLTNGKDGFPQGRPMHLIHREKHTLWFATSNASRKVTQIAADARVTVMFVDTVRFNYVSVHGRAQVVTDAGTKGRLWREAWNDDWPAGPSDPDYILLRVVGESGAYYCGDTDESGEVSL